MHKKTMILTIVQICVIITLLLTISISNIINIVDADNQSDRFVTLLSKSNGLEIPDKEAGKTEYEIADMNHDGYLDIISVGDHGSPYVNSGQHGIMVWLGDGGGFWDVQQSGDFGYGGCGIGDLNLDGLNDIAWGVHHNWNSGGIFGDTILDAALGDGSAENWIDWGEGLATNNEDWGMFATDLADFDNDGDLDIISESFGCCNGIQLYENNFNGTWTHRWAYDGGNVRYTLETGDFNADGFADFICTHYDVNVYFGNGDFTFTNKDTGLPVGSINAVDVGDFDNDGADDIVLALGNNLGVRCYRYDNQTDQWISYSTGLPTSVSYYLTQFGDINGDEDLDIIIYRDPTGTIYLGDGAGNWVQDASWTMPSPGDYSAMRVDGDIDFDGREDIIIQAETSDFPTYKNILRCYSPWQEPSQLNGYIKTPHGSETFRAGSIRWITWMSSVPSSQGQATVKIDLSTQGENGPWNTIVDNYPNSGSYQWLVQGQGSATCRIRITLTTTYDSYITISDDDFFLYNPNPTINVDAHGPYNGTTGHPVQFSGSANGGIPPYNWFWDFGDGNTSTQQNPVHSYLQPGTYRVNLTVTDTQSAIGNDTTVSIIQPSNVPPSADFIYSPISPTTIDIIQFTDTSTDDGVIIQWFWDFDDGNTTTIQHPTHLYSTYGIYHIQLQVTDDDGKSDLITKTINVYNYGPNADLSYTPLSPLKDEPIQFIDTSFDTSGDSIVSWSWDFGDGNTSTMQDPVHAYALNGSYVVNLSVMNSSGASDSVEKMVMVGSTSMTIPVFTGWNLISLPVMTGWYASDLIANTSDCLMVSWFDAENQTFRTATSSGGYDFQLFAGWGYFMYQLSNTSVVVNGSPVVNVSVPLEVGWNMIGWYHDDDTMASSLMQNISGCIMVSWYDNENETYRTATSSGGYDFVIQGGMGLFVYATVSSIWYGEG